MNIKHLRLHYTQIFLVCLLVTTLYTMSISLSNGNSQFKDNFWNHKYLIASLTRLRLALGDRIFLQAIVGKQNWMEYTSEKQIDNYQNAYTISPDGLKNIQIKLQKLYSELRKRNITLLLVIAPNKITIYPDKFSDNIQKINKYSNYDLLADYLSKHGPPILIDLRPALQNGRKKQDTYYHTDTHWNSYGAFIAYTEIMKELSKTYPELVAENLDDYQIQKTKAQLQDLSNIIGATNLLEPSVLFTPKKDNVEWAILNGDGAQSILVSTTPRKTAPTLLMYMDSFGERTQEFIAPDFQKATFIRHNSKYADSVSLKTIDILNPNVVIIEIVERVLDNEKDMNKLLNRFVEGK